MKQQHKYLFETHMSQREIARLQQEPPPVFSDTLAAALTIGFLRLEAILYQSADGLALGYDVLVKDNPDSTSWLCYDNLPGPDKTELTEREMLRILDRFAEENGLSYTECNFETINGKVIKKPRE